jgi:hypothetical protein
MFLEVCSDLIEGLLIGEIHDPGVAVVSGHV